MHEIIIKTEDIRTVRKIMDLMENEKKLAEKESPSVGLATIGLNYDMTDSKIKNYEITDDIKKAMALDKRMFL